MTGVFEGRTVVVTGGAGGLGCAVSGALLAAGAELYIPVLEPSTPARFEHAEHPRVHLAHGVDLADEESTVAYFASLPRPWATLNLAGGFSMAPVVETSLADFEAMWRMNVVTCFLATRESVRRMREAQTDAGTVGGRIVSVAARPALLPTPGMTAYTAAKAAIVAMTRSLAEELAAEQIWVNAIAPSIIDTAANRVAMPDADHELWPTPEDLARVIVELASPTNQVIRGAVIPVYGRA